MVLERLVRYGLPLFGESHLPPIRGIALQAAFARAGGGIDLHHIRAELVPIDRQLLSVLTLLERPVRMRGVLGGVEMVVPVRLESDARASAVPREPGRSVRGERANFTRLVLGCSEAKFCK